MKKVFKISLLGHFLTVLGLFWFFMFSKDINFALSSSLKTNEQITPTKRPINLINLEESTDTIFNLVEKVGGKPTTIVKNIKLKKMKILVQR